MMNGTQVKWGGGGGGGATYVFKVSVRSFVALSLLKKDQKNRCKENVLLCDSSTIFFEITSFPPSLAASFTNGAP